MHLRHTLVIVALAISVSALAQATDPQQQKYCGSGFTEKLVPEAPFGCKMSEACKAHDACYGKCDSGGSMFGTPYCTKSEFSHTRVKAKLACEGKFYANIDKSNDGKWACKGIGAMYVAAVAIGGQGPFNGKPIQLASMEDLILTSNSVDEIKLKTTKFAELSQKGLIDLQQMRRVKDEIQFTPIRKDDLSTKPTIDFAKGIGQKDLKKLQLEKLSK